MPDFKGNSFVFGSMNKKDGNLAAADDAGVMCCSPQENTAICMETNALFAVEIQWAEIRCIDVVNVTWEFTLVVCINVFDGKNCSRTVTDKVNSVRVDSVFICVFAHVAHCGVDILYSAIH